VEDLIKKVKQILPNNISPGPDGLQPNKNGDP
jgi:hypothetical protein